MTLYIFISGYADIRLVNGISICAGRVEVYQGYQWKTICDDSWDISEGNIVCKALSCGTAVLTNKNAYFGQGSGSIWQGSFRCSGMETSLSDCRSLTLSFCDHSHDAGVICSGAGIQLKLINSVKINDPCLGTVAVSVSNSWGTICDNSWDEKDADVVCKQLNCGSATAAKYKAYFGSGSGTIYLSNLKCSGTETSIFQCSTDLWGKSSCQHSNDAGVICSGATLPLRLADGDTMKCSGRLEVSVNSQWGTICDSSWDMRDANVICNQLKCGGALLANTNAYFGPGTGYSWINNIICSGKEKDIFQCSTDKWLQNSCLHSRDASVMCTKSALHVRLANGSNHCSGTVQVYINDQWGTICDDHWDMNDADVICRQMSCGNASQATIKSQFGQGNGAVWLSHLDCTGKETSIFQCKGDPWAKNTCSHSRDSGVICTVSSSSLQLRLVGGFSRCAGRLEVSAGSAWGTVCDYSWDLPAANVVCQQFGCGKAILPSVNGYFGKGNGSVNLYAPGCNGTEASLDKCPNSYWGQYVCDHQQDAGVICESKDYFIKSSFCITAYLQ
ncbi:deleted in malignant brain tumors 1 protein-like [Protopterus annectens]|uniref:deleted in malignant brain tumors 1 protein-like n=1 Tax=Protopterus annectens TaxID=7888 RepID=UPI001CF92F07|nr:deleted in malignant brain tumors 1 protein-like [Protopterus annectens]